MKDFINKLYRNHSLIYKALLFVCTTFLIVYLFPKSGKFKYSFERGKPWQSENLYAPFDFEIKKAEEVVLNNIPELADCFYDRLIKIAKQFEEISSSLNISRIILELKKAKGNSFFQIATFPTNSRVFSFE